MAQLQEHTRWIIRRSKLVVAPSDKVAVDCATTSGADAVVLDLSRDTPVFQKEVLRREAALALAKLTNWGMDILAWVNVTTAAGDVAGCAGPGLTGVLVSAETEEEIWEVDRALAAQEIVQGVPVGTLQVELVVSSARAVLDLLALARASARIVCLNLDTEGLALEMCVEESEQVDQFLYARGRLLMVARLYGMEAHALAFVFVEPGGEQVSLEWRARQANRTGYRGALCWNPGDAPVLNRAFAPSEADLQYSRETKEVMEDAMRQGKGAATLRSGTLVDIAMLRHSDALLSWAEAIVQRERAKKGYA